MEEIIKRLNELEVTLKRLENTTTIPLTVDKAFRNRFRIDKKTELKAQTDKSASAENVTTSAGGGNIVLGAPDGFRVDVDDTGTPRYYPFWL